MTSDCRSACSSQATQDPTQGGRMVAKAQSPAGPGPVDFESCQAKSPSGANCGPAIQ